MAITWLGNAGSTCYTFDNSGASTSEVYGLAPALNNGDRLFAVVFGGGTINVPSGWTKIVELTQLMSVPSQPSYNCLILSKNAVTSGDSNQVFTFTRTASSTQAFSAVCFGARGVNSIPEIKQRTDTGLERFGIKHAVVDLESATSASAGELHVMIALSYYHGPVSPNCTVPSGATRWTNCYDQDFGRKYICGAYRIRNSGESSSGQIDISPTAQNVNFDYNAVATFTLRLSEQFDITDTDGYVAAASPLGDAYVLGENYSRPVRIAVESPLGAQRIVSIQDFYDFLSSDPRHFYTMHLNTPAGAVRVPISSWQATLQVEDASFVQCVVPAADRWVDELDNAESFVVFRKTTLLDGREIEAALASATLQTLTFAQGGFNATATLQGYVTGLALDPDPVATPMLRDVQTVFTYADGIRVRCAIDWQLRPGMTCYYGTTPIVVQYINYYVTQGQAYMDVGGA